MYYSISDRVYRLEGRNLVLCKASEGQTRTNRAGHSETLQAGRWHRTDQSKSNSKSNPKSDRAAKIKHAIVHEGDVLGENVVAWKTGKAIGGAVANFAIAHGASTDPETARILSETIVQSTTATLINAVKEYRKTGAIDGRKVAAYFVKQTAAAYLGKYAHAGTEWAVQSFGMADMAEHVLPILAGKVTGISTVIGMGRYHLDSRIVDAVIDRSNHDVAILQSWVAKLAQQPNLQKAIESSDRALQALLWDLTQLGILIACQNQNPTSHSLQ